MQSLLSMEDMKKLLTRPCPSCGKISMRSLGKEYCTRRCLANGHAATVKRYADYDTKRNLNG